MSDDLTRAVAEATEGKDREGTARWPECCRDTYSLAVEETLAVLVPVVEARVREARAEALTDAADAWTQGAWANTPRHKDRVADRMAASRYAGYWLRERAEEARRARPGPGAQ